MDTEDPGVLKKESDAGSKGMQSGDGESGEVFREVAEYSKDTARYVVQQIQSQTGSILSELKNRLARELEGVARALRQTETGLKEGNQESIAQIAETGAQKVERLSEYLREADREEFMERMENFARRRPAVFVGGALAAGFLLGQVLRGPARRPTDEKGDLGSKGRSSLEYRPAKDEEAYHERH